MNDIQMEDRLLVTDESFGSSSYHDPFTAPKKSSRSRARFRIHYEYIFWTIFLLITAYTILDRFYINLFPMSINFKPLSGQCYMFGVPCGNSLSSKGIVIPTSIAIFDIYGRATGRLFLTVFGALFWTQCKSTENFLMEHHPSFVNLGDLRTLHNRTHYILGMFFMAIPMIIHLLITFLPAMAGVPLTISALRAPNKVTPFIAPNPATGVAEMFLTFDDIYRVVSSLFLFLVVFPFSIANATRKRWFSPTQWLHIGGAAMFAVDMIRRSPHAQVFNTPVVFYFLLDRIFGLWFYRTGLASIIHNEVLDENYLVMFLYVPKQLRRRGIGSTYYIQFPGLEGAFEIAHPFIAMQNHSGDPLIPEWRNRDASSSVHKFYIDRSAGERKKFTRRSSIGGERGDADEEAKFDALLASEDSLFGGASSVITSETDDVIFFSNWNTALFVQVHRWNRGENTFTDKLAKKEVASRIRFWGPYTSEYCQITPMGQNLPPLVLIGTGAGAGPLLDFYQFITANKIELVNPVSVYFSTNSVGLFQFTTDLICSRVINNFSVSAHLTSADEYTVDEDNEKGTHDTHSSTRDMKLGRLSFMEVLSAAPSNAQVFFCGAPALQWMVQLAARTFNLEYYPGHRFASDGMIACQRVSACRWTCSCNKMPCCLVY